ncbi:MAG: glycosyltransferase [Candidatus Bathyarchaeota archaeon]|nr:glycosyltransferase [Candidatus Bathyarchaeota archaeon]
MTKRIGVFCPTLNVYGGGEYVAISLANTLAQNNFEVVLFSSGKVNPQAIQNYFGETLHPRIQTLQQPTNFAPHGLGDFYQTIVHSYIAKKKCSLFIDAFSNCVYPWTEVSYIHFPFLNHFAFSKTFPYLTRPRITHAGTVPHVLLEKKLIDYRKRLVLANSIYTADEIKSYSGKSVDVLYPPFSSIISRIGKASAKTARENLVVTVSRIDSNKLLERIPHIAAQTNPNIKFVVIGRLCSPHVLSHLEGIVKRMGLSERVKFFPNAPADQKIALLKSAKLYLHTMIGEHFGISIVEAMALGCVPIVHDSGGMREFVPAHLRYLTIEQAAAKINEQVAGWSMAEAEEMKEIADRFSIAHFSERFMELFNKHYT